MSTEISLYIQHLRDVHLALIIQTVNDFADVFVVPGEKLGFYDVLKHAIELQLGAETIFATCVLVVQRKKL